MCGGGREERERMREEEREEDREEERKEGRERKIKSLKNSPRRSPLTQAMCGREISEVKKRDSASTSLTLSS